MPRASLPDVAGAVEVARELADRLLVPYAEQVDVGGVRRETVDVLARAGLLGLAGPRGYGGAQAPAPVQREVTEVLAGACGATWFVCTQHSLPLQALSRSENVALKERQLHAMCTGGRLAGVAIAHVRRPGPPLVTATRTDGGWRFDGSVAWTTSWGIADLLLLGGLGADGELVLVLVPAGEQPGLTASPPLRLAAMQATSTVSLSLAGLQVADADVVAVERAAAWLAADRYKTANATPAVFGLTAAAVRLLAQTAERREDRVAAALARDLDEEAQELRGRAYALLDHVPATEQEQERLALRGASLELVVRAATALVAATGGGAVGLDSPAQRMAREAVFHLVQAQTPPVREATLRRLGERVSRA